MTALRQRMMDQMVLRGLAPKTQMAYLAAVRGLAAYYRRSPDHLSVEELQRYLLYCLRERSLSHSTCLQILNGLRFFYLKTIGWSSADFELPRPRREQKLPEILNRAELTRLFDAVRNLKHRTLLKTTYASGLRVGEAVRLRIVDIDSERMTIRIRQAKGAKDRDTLLTPALLDALREYYRAHRPAGWLFPNGHNPKEPLSISSAQRVFTKAKRTAGISKQGGIHGLRHAFATHQIEAGLPIHRLQRLLGHRSIRSTLRYVHLADSPGYLIEGAADLLAGADREAVR